MYSGLVIKRALYGKITEEVIQRYKAATSTTITTTTTTTRQNGETGGEKGMEKEKGGEREGEEDDSIVDVTIPLQYLVEKSELRVVSPKRTLKGFYDPCPGEKKHLFVEYTFGGSLRRATLMDDEDVLLPSNGK